jgi:predicted dehydrogenase
VSSTSQSPIRVGVVGANPSAGWAPVAHLPALANLPGFEVVAVATTRRDSAIAGAEMFGARHAFTSADDLAAHPDVDLVAVTVKVPGHAAAIRAALANGKHVFSEWPLGVDLAEATELAQLAEVAGVVHAVGLQGTHSPGARFVHDLLADGRIGRVQSVAIVHAGGLAGTRVAQGDVWGLDPAGGISVLRITGGHVLSTLAQAVGQITDVSAVVANLNEHVTVIETGETVAMGTPSQVGLLGRLANGAVVSITVQGGNPPGASGFFLRIVGTDGALTITPVQAAGFLHISEWNVQIAVGDGPAEPLGIPDRYRVVPDGVPAGLAVNVAAGYLEIGRAVAERRAACPNFTTAMHYHRLLATIDAASDTGRRQPVRQPDRGRTGA